LIVFKGSVLNFFKLIWSGALSNISVIITDHLVEESFGLISLGNLHAIVLDDIDDGDALVIQLTLDLLLVLGKSIRELLVLWVLLDGADGSNCGSFRSNLVLESNRE